MEATDASRLVCVVVVSYQEYSLTILWPRWVARIGVTRATEACFLTADRQCTELPLLRLPRLVPEVVGCDPFVPRDLARVGWRGARCREGLCKKPIPVATPRRFVFAPGSGARGIPRVARPAIRRVAAMRRNERGPRRLSPALRGGKGIAGSPRAPQFGPPEGGRGARGWGDRGGGEGSRISWV